MTPKQKALQLINIFYSYCESEFHRKEIAIKCALEMLSVAHQCNNKELKLFYEEVKEELEKCNTK